MVVGAILCGALGLRLLASYRAIGERVIVHFIERVCEGAQISIVAVLNACRWYCVVTAAGYRLICKFPVSLKEGSSELTDGVCMPAGVKTFANVLVLRVFVHLWRLRVDLVCEREQ